MGRSSRASASAARPRGRSWSPRSLGFHLPTLQLTLISAAALGGLVWGWLRERTEGMAAPVVAHAIWTGAMVLVPPT